MKTTSNKNKSSRKNLPNSHYTRGYSAVGSKSPSGIITIPEIAILGAASFVLWKNRNKIFNFLEQNGVEVPEVLSEDFSTLVQRGASYIIGERPGKADLHM